MKKSENIEVKKVKVIQKEAPEVLNDNQIYIEDFGVVEIKPTKLKYFEILGKAKNSMYGNVLLIKQMGYNNLLVYTDGREIVENALKAIFDVDEIDFYDNLTTVNLNKIIKLANEVNEVKIDDFLENQKREKEENQKNKKA
jgi:hypothetical protein